MKCKQKPKSFRPAIYVSSPLYSAIWSHPFTFIWFNFFSFLFFPNNRWLLSTHMFHIQYLIYHNTHMWLIWLSNISICGRHEITIIMTHSMKFDECQTKKKYMVHSIKRSPHTQAGQRIKEKFPDLTHWFVILEYGRQTWFGNVHCWLMSIPHRIVSNQFHEFQRNQSHKDKPFMCHDETRWCYSQFAIEFPKKKTQRGNICWTIYRCNFKSLVAMQLFDDQNCHYSNTRRKSTGKMFNSPIYTTTKTCTFLLWKKKSTTTTSIVYSSNSSGLFRNLLNSPMVQVVIVIPGICP